MPMCAFRVAIKQRRPLQSCRSFKWNEIIITRLPSSLHYWS